jgi:REP element-mobilizing transposase RayT
MENYGKHHRRSIRLPEYDYSQPGDYFITLVTHNHISLFGSIENEHVRLSTIGQIAREEWINTPLLRQEVDLGIFVIMPNHFHGIIHLEDSGRGTARRAPTVEQFQQPVIGSIPTIIRAYKSAVTKRANEYLGTPGAKIWQRNYYEHIICSDEEYAQIAAYIEYNPLSWLEDKERIN